MTRTLATSVRKTDHGTSTELKLMLSSNTTGARDNGTGDFCGCGSVLKGWRSRGYGKVKDGSGKSKMPVFVGRQVVRFARGGEA